MPEIALMARKVALLCLVPDSGHLIPLIRIGKLLEEAGAEVALVCSEEVAHLAEGHLQQVLRFGSVRPANFTDVLTRITDSSEVSRRIWLNRWFEERYTEPVQEAVLRQLDNILELLRGIGPALLVADDHLFRGVAQWLAGQCECPLVLNYSAGSNYRFIRRKPWLNRTRRQERAISFAARVVPKLVRVKERLLTPEHGRCRRRRLEFLDTQWARLDQESGAEMNVPHISAGLIELENRYLKDRVELIQNLIAFPSTPPLCGRALPASIQQWLEAGGPIVYVCFGTMAPQRLRFSEQLVDICIKKGFRVLWASPAPPVALGRYGAADFRWEKWVPQVTLLERPEVAGFVTHAGGGSVQEALWFGKPLICIPLTWDQPYNAWVAEQLGFGVNLNKHRLTRTELCQAFTVLRGGELASAAKWLGEEMRSQARQNSIVTFLAGCVASGQPKLPKADSRVGVSLHDFPHSSAG